VSQFLALVVLHPELPALVQLGERHGGRDARSRGRPAMVMVPISLVTVGASLRTSLGMLLGTSLGALLGPLNPCYTSLGTYAYSYMYLRHWGRRRACYLYDRARLGISSEEECLLSSSCRCNVCKQCLCCDGRRGGGLGQGLIGRPM